MMLVCIFINVHSRELTLLGKIQGRGCVSWSPKPPGTSTESGDTRPPSSGSSPCPCPSSNYFSVLGVCLPIFFYSNYLHRLHLGLNLLERQPSLFWLCGVTPSQQKVFPISKKIRVTSVPCSDAPRKDWKDLDPGAHSGFLKVGRTTDSCCCNFPRITSASGVKRSQLDRL